MKLKMCITCGERYFGEGPYCSTKCREENMRIKEHAKKILKGEAPKKKEIKSELAKINEEAREAGMSYGQYVAFCECEKERRKWRKGVKHV